MILHPGVLALSLGSAITLILLLQGAFTGSVILLKWDYNSSSAYQLTLERRTYLISTLVAWGLTFHIASVFLFIYTMEDIHKLFVGAMCATGSLNANPIGWYALLSKIVTFFLAGFWIALNFIDQKIEDYPLIRLKYVLLILLLPFLIVDSTLQSIYFLGLDPDIITSCCGSLFSNSENTNASAVAPLPVLPSMVFFYILSLLLIGVLFLNRQCNISFLRYLLTFISLVFFFISISSIISFGSIYIYEMPMHHCPFDILQGEYNYIGFPLYFLLFTGVFFGMLPGLLQPLFDRRCLQTTLFKQAKTWVTWSLISTSGFILLLSFAVYTSNLILFTE